MPRYDQALVVGKFAPPHRGHQFLIDAATEAAERLTIVVGSNPDFPDMPSATRAAWIAELYPEASVIVADDCPPNDALGEEHHAHLAGLVARHGLRPDVVLTSEAMARGSPPASASSTSPSTPRGPTCPSAARWCAPTSTPTATLLDQRIYRYFVERVVFLGAESTGKTTLTRRMADELGTVHVDEYGRTHYEQRGGVLTLDDYVEIAETHRRLEDEAILRANRYLFVDTDAVTTMFFSRYYNGDSLPALGLLAADCRERYRHHIVCAPDIPFEQDGWRDNDVWRARMHGMVLHDLAVREIDHSLVRGSLGERVATVRAILAGQRASTAGAAWSIGPRPTT